MIRILIVDADHTWATELAYALRDHPESVFTIVTATSAQEAQKHVEQASQVFDIFLISQGLESDTDSITALKTLRLLSPTTASVVLFTKYDAEAEHRAYQSGVHHYLPKDLDQVALIWVLRSLHSQRPLLPGGRDWIGVLALVADKTQRTPSVDEVADVIVRGGLQLGFERARLWLFDASTKTLIGRAQAGNEGLADFIDSEMPLGESYYGQHMREQHEPRKFHGRKQGPSFMDRKFGKQGFKAPTGDWTIVPLWSGDTLLGVLSLDDAHTPRTIDDDQLALLRLFGRLSVAALERARESYERDWLKKLTEMAEEAQQKRSVQEVGDVVVEWAVQLGFERARLWQYNEDQRTLIGLSEKGNENLERFVGFSMPIRKSRYSRQVPKEREPRYFTGREKGKAYIDGMFPKFRPPKGEWTSIPLQSGTQCLGMLVLDNASKSRRITGEQKALLSLLSRQVVAVLERARASYGLEKLTEMTEAAQRARSVDDVAKVIVQGGLLLDFKRARLWQVKPEGGNLILAGLYQEGNTDLEGFSEKRVPFADSPYLQSILDQKEHEPIYFLGRNKGQAHLDRISENFEPPISEWVEIPLWSKDRLLGTLSLDNAQEKWSIHPHKHELLRLFGRQAAAALERAQAEEESRRLKAVLLIAKAVDETLDIEQTIYNVLSELQNLLPDSNPFILIYNESRHVLEFTAASTRDFYHIDSPDEIERKYVDIGSTSIAGQLASDSLSNPEINLTNVGDIKEYRKKSPYLELIKETQSEICVTLMVDNRLLGVLAIEHKDKDAFKRIDEELLLIVRPTISSALDRALKSQRLRKLIDWKKDSKEKLIKQLGYEDLGDQTNKIAEEVDEVLLWLFWDIAHDKLEVEYYKYPKSGPKQRNSVLLKALTGHTSPYYLKIGRIERIKKELTNFQNYINGKIDFYATYERSRLLKNIGGITLNFKGVPVSDLVSFPAYLDKQNETKNINDAIYSLFDSWRSHYDPVVSKVEISISDDPNHSLGLKKTLFQAYSDVWETRWHDRMRKLAADPDALWLSWQVAASPIAWLLESVGLGSTSKTDSSDVMNMSTAVTHGDLNGDGLFVDSKSGRIYVSDYKRTGPGPILQDFLELEVNILVRLIPPPQDDRQIFTNLVDKVLLIPYNTEKPSRSLEGHILDPQVSRTWEIVYELRRFMYMHTHRHSDDEASYEQQTLWGLLFNAANLATLLRERGGKQQEYERALLLAHLVCKRLAELDTSLPPYPPATAQINILLEGDFQQFTSKELGYFVSMLAQIVNIDPGQIRILGIEPGSIRITIEMPEKAAEDLVISVSEGNDREIQGRRVLEIKLCTEAQNNSSRDTKTPFNYDVFISYSHRDRQWVSEKLLPRLEQEGLRVAVDYRDFKVGVPILINIEKAVDNSRHTLIVLTPEWISSKWGEFESLIILTSDPSFRQQKMIPLLLEKCDLPQRIAILTCADFTNPDEHDLQMGKLVETLRT